MKHKQVFYLAIALLIGITLFTSCGAPPQPDPSGEPSDGEQHYLPLETKLSLEDIYRLAALGDALTLADIPGWEAMSQWGEMLKSSPSERRFAIYSVESGYRLEVGAETAGSETPSYITLTPVWDANSGFDIRGANITKFLREHPSTAAVTADEARAVLASYLGGSPRLEETLPEFSIGDEACYHYYRKRHEEAVRRRQALRRRL